MLDIRAIAIHLPQFHPFPENDTWWGKGFTEWTNVTKAKPFFKGHYQPHLPADLGFYDLRLEESRVAQASLAKSYGISGFCYYHYWFNGKRLINRPLDDMLNTKTPDFPFMLCWANENWTRRWDGAESEVLIKQEYSNQDDIEHIRFLMESFLADDRYIKIDGKPFFLFYRPQLFPDIRKTMDTWREEAHKVGLKGLYLGYMQNAGFNVPPQKYGFDCAVDFQPDFAAATSIRIKPSILDRALHRLNISKNVLREHTIIDYGMYAQKMMNRKLEKDIFPGITPMWDNASRRKTAATIFKDSTPELYQEWLVHIIKQYSTVEIDTKFIFINAWNEWAEGNHLEPCQKWGLEYLKATKEALENG